MADIPATDKKLREALFFLERLREHSERIPGDPEHFEFFLSAYLSAGRSVTFALQVERKDEYDAWFPGWKGTLTQEERDLLDFMLAQRNAELHQGGANVQVTVEFIPMTALRGDRRHPAYGFQWFGPPGVRPPEIGHNVHYFELGGTPVQALATCRRYADLLSRLVRAFKEAHPHP